MTSATDTVVAPALAGRVIEWFESGKPPDDLFAADAFIDASFPQWRLQAHKADDVLALRSERHPFPGKVRAERLEPTSRGFLLEIEERWHHEGQDWYCREAIRADVVDGRISELKVYCTGDWDEAAVRRHAAEVTLLRP